MVQGVLTNCNTGQCYDKGQKISTNGLCPRSTTSLGKDVYERENLILTYSLGGWREGEREREGGREVEGGMGRKRVGWREGGREERERDTSHPHTRCDQSHTS